MYDLKEKIVVVTGSGRGIGREISVNLAKQGARIVVNVKKRIEDGNATLDLVNNYSNGIMVQADVSTREGCKKLLDETLNKFGKCDVLVNNAGIAIAMPFLDTDDRLIEKMISTNLLSNIYCSQEFAKIMERNSSIIVMSSLAGIRPMALLSLYGVTKSAIIKMTEYLAIEFAPKGIRVNAVAPSVVRTRMGESLLDLLNLSEEDYGKKYTLTGRIILPEEVAETVNFLIRSESITGQTITIDSGQSLMNML